MVPNRYRYVAEATNRLLQLAGDGAQVDSRTLAAAATQAEQALESLLTDPAFHALLTSSAAQSALGNADRRELEEELANLAVSFVRAEAEALKRLGHSEHEVQEILWLAASCKNLSDMPPLSHDALAGKIHNLKVACGRASAELRKGVDAKTRKNWLSRLGLGMAGISVMVADVALFPTSAATSVVSVSMSTLMIDRSLG
jgi:hypothetical protein